MLIAACLILIVILTGTVLYQSSKMAELKEDLDVNLKQCEVSFYEVRELQSQITEAQQKTRKYQKENSRLRKKLEKPVEEDDTDYLDMYLVNKKSTPKKITLDAGKVEIDVPGRLEINPEEDKV